MSTYPVMWKIKIPYPLPNIHGDVEWVDNSIPHFIIDLITHPCWDSRQSVLVKRDSWMTHSSLIYREPYKLQDNISIRSCLCAYCSLYISQWWIKCNMHDNIAISIVHWSSPVSRLTPGWQHVYMTLHDISICARSVKYPTWSTLWHQQTQRRLTTKFYIFCQSCRPQTYGLTDKRTMRYLHTTHPTHPLWAWEWSKEFKILWPHANSC